MINAGMFTAIGIVAIIVAANVFVWFLCWMAKDSDKRVSEIQKHERMKR